MKIKLIITLLSLSIASSAFAQQFSVSSNLIDYASLGTLNIQGSAACGRRITAELAADYNPWTFHKGDPQKQMQNRQQTYAVGMRYWPWHVYSGWWLSCMAQYQEYNRGGILSRQTEEGDAFGISVGGGYSLMIHERINLDFGLAFWSGRKTYITYECPSCGKMIEDKRGSKWFIMPNEVRVAIQYIF